MRKRRTGTIAAWGVAAGIAFGLSGAAMAQTAGAAANTPPMIKAAQHAKAVLGARVKYLSYGAANFVNLANVWQKLQAGHALGGPNHAMSVGVSHVYLDSTRFSGGVQSESSTAWCGPNAVIAFNDSGSLLASNGGQGLLALAGSVTPSEGFPFVGYANSTNANKKTPKFTDQGYPAIPTAYTSGEGDPVVVCSDSSNFLLSQLFYDGTGSGPCPETYCNEVVVQESHNGGATFAAPIVAATEDDDTGFLDKEWMTLSPVNPSNVYVSYTNFYNYGYGPDCGSDYETAIDLVTSSDGGNTWSAPTEVNYVCGYGFLQGSQVGVDSAGNVFVVYENFASDFFTREIDVQESTDNGATFGAPITVSSVNPVGDGDFDFGLQGAIRDFEFPMLAIGAPGASNADDLFVVWNDGDNRVADQWMALDQYYYGYGDGMYGYSDVKFTTSSNHGASWSTPVTVNLLPSTYNSDHYQPDIAAAANGTLGVCWYDRNKTPANWYIVRKCGGSSDNGATWGNGTIAQVGNSVVNQDALIAYDYMGDYDGLAADSTGNNAGFLGGFVQTLGGAQKVLATR